MVNDPPPLRRSTSTESLTDSSADNTTPRTQTPAPGAGILGVETSGSFSILDDDAELPPLVRNRAVAVTQADKSVHAAAHDAISRRNRSVSISAANSQMGLETSRRNAEQLIENVKKLSKFGTAFFQAAEDEPEAKHAARLRLRIKLISEEPKSLAAMLAELRNITENLDTATLLLAMKNLIRFLNDNADLTTSDLFARIQLTEADKLDKYILDHLLKELLQEAAIRLQQTTPDSQETIGKLVLPEAPEVIDRV